MRLSSFVALFAAFTIGAMAVEIRNSRETTRSAIVESYWQGYADGFREHVRTDRIEEDDPRWDCKTMGNKKCGR